ncbi:TPA: radical SAM protein [Candidatus Poribacteria bacterium]|nr:radical SAM protein [Candidatus Poribacteria bacterium]
MKSLSFLEAMRITKHGFQNYFAQKPLVVSFEVTHSCTANCQHCDKGGFTKENNLLQPEDYSKLVSEFRPLFVQISGGEPLLREDVTDIVRAIKHPRGESGALPAAFNRLPRVIFVTNASLLNAENYLELNKAGVDQFSVSLDFPNEKHDEFRRHPGLYAHLEATIPRLAADFGYNNIAMNTAITLQNLPYLRALADKAKEWNVDISYSAYSILRTGDKEHFISSEEDLETLRQTIQELIKLKKEKGHILNPPSILLKTYQFFKDGYIPNCRAGKRFLVVRPDGKLNPCSMYPQRQYKNQAEILADFSSNNQCGECYVAIRAYSDKSVGALLKDSVLFYFSHR